MLAYATGASVTGDVVEATTDAAVVTAESTALPPGVVDAPTVVVVVLSAACAVEVNQPVVPTRTREKVAAATPARMCVKRLFTIGGD